MRKLIVSVNRSNYIAVVGNNNKYYIDVGVQGRKSWLILSLKPITQCSLPEAVPSVP